MTYPTPNFSIDLTGQTALVTGASSGLGARFSRILATIAASKYSIHDLSRSRGEGDENLARLNMPLELGMAAAFCFERENSGRPHRWLALVPEGYAYQSFVSDLAGFDPALVARWTLHDRGRRR